MILPSAILVFGLPTLLYAQEFTVPGFLQNDTSDETFSFYIAQDLNVRKLILKILSFRALNNWLDK